MREELRVEAVGTWVKKPSNEEYKEKYEQCRQLEGRVYPFNELTQESSLIPSRVDFPVWSA